MMPPRFLEMKCQFWTSGTVRPLPVPKGEACSLALSPPIAPASSHVIKGPEETADEKDLVLFKSADACPPPRESADVVEGARGLGLKGVPGALPSPGSGAGLGTRSQD